MHETTTATDKLRACLREVACDAPRHYLTELAAVWCERALRAGLRSQRLAGLAEAWALLAVPGLGCDGARREIVREILSTLGPFERAALTECPGSTPAVLELGYVTLDEGVPHYTALGAELLDEIDQGRWDR